LKIFLQKNIQIIAAGVYILSAIFDRVQNDAGAIAPASHGLNLGTN
jgi:hypothetical protein